MREADVTRPNMESAKKGSGEERFGGGCDLFLYESHNTHTHHNHPFIVVIIITTTTAEGYFTLVGAKAEQSDVAANHEKEETIVLMF